MLELAMDGFYRRVATRCSPGPSVASRAPAARRSAAHGGRDRAPRARIRLDGNIDGSRRAPRGGRRSWMRSRTTDLARRLDAAANLANTELSLDRYAESRRHAERASQSRARRQGAMFPSLSIVLASHRDRGGPVRGRDGDPRRAPSSRPGLRATPRDSRGCSSIARCSPPPARATSKWALAAAEECAELDAEHGPQLHHGLVAVVLAPGARAGGRAETSRRVCWQDPRRTTSRLIPCGWRVGCFELLTRCWLALDARRRQRRAASAAARARRAARPAVRDCDGRSRGGATLRSSSATASSPPSARSPRPRSERSRRSVEVALSRALAGRAFALAATASVPREELARAATTLEAHGAELRYAEAERELRRLGRRRHRAVTRGERRRRHRQRSRAASSRSPGSSSTAGRTPRSPPSSSSA